MRPSSDISQRIVNNVVLPACFITLFAAFSPCFATSLPDPTWAVPGLPNPDGSPAYPMWTGTSFNDSAGSTGAYRLHEIGITGKGVSAAVIDLLVDTAHPSLSRNIIGSAAFTYSLIDVNDLASEPYHPSMVQLPYTVTSDGDTYNVFIGYGTNIATLPNAPAFASNNHGTHVSGTVLAMAPDAGLVLGSSAWWTGGDHSDPDNLKVSADLELGLGFVAQLAAQHNIVSVNCSWGENFFPGSVAEAEALFGGRYREYLNAILNAGVVPVFSSGNSSINNAIAVPAALSGTLAVGSLSQTGLITEFSNQSGKVVLLAPGNDINSSVPFSGFDIMSGTSMAAPHVTGAIALLASGARNASADEIVQSLIAGADPVRYDGGLVLPASLFPFTADNTVAVFFNQYLNIDITADHTMDEWRDYSRLSDIINLAAQEAMDKNNGNLVLSEWADEYNAIIAAGTFPDNGDLEHVDYRFLRVDKAYMHLTESRTEKQANAVSPINPVGSSMLQAFAGELGADINKDTADIFQRLDAQTPTTLAGVSRQMSPQLAYQAIEKAQFGSLALHRSLGRTGEILRIEGDLFSALPAAADRNALANIDPVAASAARLWVEGHGSIADRSGTGAVADYDSNLAGVMFGLEKRKGDLAFGLFGSWADMRVKSSDGKATGDWYNAGLYARYDREDFFLHASTAYDYGKFDSNRSILVPGAIFTSSLPGEFIVLDPFARRAGAEVKTHGVSGRLAAGYDAWKANGWTFGTRVEGGVAHSHMPKYNERGAGALTLRLDRYNTTYGEAGAGLALSKIFGGPGGSRFAAAAKVMGMYGGSFGGNITGRFSQYGSRFEFSPERIKTAWLLPEASLTWRVNDRVDLSVAYSGRFGKRYSENAGYLKVGISW